MNKSHYLAGIKVTVPIIFAFLPIGIAFAVIAREAGFSLSETVFMSASVFAGASQIMAAGMYLQGAGIITIAIATFILNFRHFIMSACVMEKMKDVPRWMRVIASFFITDESFAIFTTDKKSTAAFFFGIITVTYGSWVLGSFLGAVLSDFLPAIVSASFAVAFYAMFLSMLVPSLTQSWRLLVLVIITAICNTILVQFIDAPFALVISTLVCAFIGMFFVDVSGGSSR